MATETLEWGPFYWRWKTFGSGKKLLLAFPGFNRDPDDYHAFGKHLQHTHTILAFELFFHGNSWSSISNDTPEPLTYESLKKMIDQVLERHHADRFEVMAYSFGGRLALNLLEIYQNKIAALYLMAPDGLRFNCAFWFGTQSFTGRWLFKQFVDNPYFVLKFLELASQAGMLNRKSADFYRNHISDLPSRLKVYHVWLLHRLTVPYPGKIAKLLNQNRIPTLLFYGKHDRIITPESARKFLNKAGSCCTMITYNCGHRLFEMHEQICSEIGKRNF